MIRPALSVRHLAIACLLACVSAPLAAREPARERATAEIAALLHDAVARCWNMPAGDGFVGKSVKVRFALNRDGSLAGKPQVLDPREEPGFAMLAASARRAVIRCAPYKGLARYERFHDVWRVVTLNFVRQD